MIEVEVKLPVADLDTIKGKLLKMGFKETAIIKEHDTYFDNRQGDIRANGEALRVRETKDHLTGESRAQINFKGKKLDTCTMTREELETGVEDGAICRNILQAIGYAPATPEVPEVTDEPSAAPSEPAEPEASDDAEASEAPAASADPVVEE